MIDFRLWYSARILFLGVWMTLASVVQAGTPLSVHALSVDHLVDPLGMDNRVPRMSWKLGSDKPATLQTAYEIRVSAVGAGGPEPVWGTGKVDSDQSLYVFYAGPELKTATRYTWQVRVWDNHGRESDWSAPAYWEMGLLQASDWRAQWITYPWQESKDSPQPSPVFRHVFPLDCNIDRARLYITALGLYEAVINGERVGDAYFTPGWTSYQERLQYQVYDVTAQLQQGENAIGVTLGDGWYRGYMSWEMQRNLYGDTLALLAQLQVDCADGRQLVVGSSPDWKVATGVVRASDIYEGEIQDWRQHPAGWDRPGFDDSGWQASRRFTGTVPRLVASAMPPVRATEIVRPVDIQTGPDGETIVDMGQNLVGWVRLRVRGEAGDTLELRHAEVLNPDGSLYLDNLRNARQEVSYTLADDTPQELEPYFTFQGFRYVGVKGYPGELDANSIEAVVLHSDLPIVGQFETSDPMINQLQSNIVWGQRGNFLEVPTDCPQRDERMGWTGDIQVFANTATFNMHSAAFFNRWLADVRADQKESGAIPVVVPDVMSRLRVTSAAIFFLTRLNGASGWSDVITELPMTVYQRYGDTRVLEESYPAMQGWVAYQQERAASRWRRALQPRNWFSGQNRRDSAYIWNFDYSFSDWLSPEPFSATFSNTVYFARSTELLAEAADILGKTDDRDRYRELHRNIREAFQRQFVDQQTGRLKEDVQGAYVMALQFGLLEPDQAKVAARRINELVSEGGYHLATGFLSTPHLLSVLQDHGYLDTAYRVMMQRDYPSWLYPISMGATTIWERWGSIEPDGSFGDEGMNSFNHYAKGAVGDWMYRNIGGIAPAAPGYKKVRIAPIPGGGLEHASAQLESPYGMIASAWRLEGERIHVSVQIPPNTTAEFVFPGSGATILRDGEPLAVGDGIHQINHVDGKAVLRLGSGQYAFSGSTP